MWILSVFTFGCDETNYVATFDAQVVSFSGAIDVASNERVVLILGNGMNNSDALSGAFFNLYPTDGDGQIIVWGDDVQSVTEYASGPVGPCRTDYSMYATCGISLVVLSSDRACAEVSPADRWLWWSFQEPPFDLTVRPILESDEIPPGLEATYLAARDCPADLKFTLDVLSRVED